MLTFLLGALTTLLVQFALDTMRRWRESEADRKKTRTTANMIKTEIEMRLLYLNHSRKNDDHAVTITDIIYLDNFEKSGPSFEFSKLGAEFRKIFDTFTNFLVQFNPKTSGLIVSHYQGMSQRLSQFTSQISTPFQSKQSSLSMLNEIRSETEILINQLNLEVEALAPRSYLVWLPLWMAGKS